MMNATRVGEWLVLCALAAGQWACTSLQAVGPGDATPVEAIEVGDRISVVDSAGETTELAVTAVGPGFIEGTTAAGTLTRLEGAQLKELRVRRNAPGKTAALVGGLSVLLFVEGLSEAGVMQ